jgi:PqqD family protein of HPr-rel-A system
MPDRADVPRRSAVEAFVSGAECLVYHPVRDEATALNASATEIWQLCDGTRNLDGIARVLGERYGLDHTLFVADVEAAVESLRARGLLDAAMPDAS